MERPRQARAHARTHRHRIDRSLLPFTSMVSAEMSSRRAVAVRSARRARRVARRASVPFPVLDLAGWQKAHPNLKQA
jgi:hypothetical protein